MLSAMVEPVETVEVNECIWFALGPCGCPWAWSSVHPEEIPHQDYLLIEPRPVVWVQLVAPTDPKLQVAEWHQVSEVFGYLTIGEIWTSPRLDKDVCRREVAWSAKAEAVWVPPVGYMGRGRV